jgi:hypothetical protein
MFSRRLWERWALRPYQVEVAREIVGSIERGEGRQFAVAFARQSGKDEMLAQIEAYLMDKHKAGGGSILVVNPTFKPQGQIARRRLIDRLAALDSGKVMGASGYSVGLGMATCGFLSAAPAAQARGETASLLMACNEAQDVTPGRWDAVFDPMGAASHVTQVFSGTVWTSRTLLARQMAFLAEQERKDGKRRVFKVTWEEVAKSVPAYGEHVRARIAQFGRDHPFIRTEYFLEEMDDESRLFGAARRAQMRGYHPRQRSATPGKVYALLVDVAGADESAEFGMRSAESYAGMQDTAPYTWRSRDATALTVVEVDLDGLNDPLVLRPRYRVVDRRSWTGESHANLHGIIVDLARNVWAARYVVVDATGVGAGLAGFLQQALPRQVVSFTFSAQTKSKLGWDFLALVEGGRYKEYVDDGAPETGQFWAQVEACRAQVSDGPGRLLRWGVEHRATHDDLLVSAALCAVLDGKDWMPRVARGR